MAANPLTIQIDSAQLEKLKTEFGSLIFNSSEQLIRSFSAKTLHYLKKIWTETNLVTQEFFKNWVKEQPYGGEKVQRLAVCLTLLSEGDFEYSYISDDSDDDFFLEDLGASTLGVNLRLAFENPLREQAEFYQRVDNTGPYLKEELEVLSRALKIGDNENRNALLANILRQAIQDEDSTTPLGKYPRKKIQKILGYDIIEKHQERLEALEREEREDLAAVGAQVASSSGNREPAESELTRDLEARLAEQSGKLKQLERTLEELERSRTTAQAGEGEALNKLGQMAEQQERIIRGKEAADRQLEEALKKETEFQAKEEQLRNEAQRSEAEKLQAEQGRKVAEKLAAEERAAKEKLQADAAASRKREEEASEKAAQEAQKLKEAQQREVLINQKVAEERIAKEKAQAEAVASRKREEEQRRVAQAALEAKKATEAKAVASRGGRPLTAAEIKAARDARNPGRK
jgi:hypothetical protein